MTARRGSWEELERPAPDAVTVGGVELRRGSAVVLRPRAGADILDRALAGRRGRIESIEQDTDGHVQLVVVADDDPGRDLGYDRRPGHRFFFAIDEVEPLAYDGPSAPAGARILVAGIGNLFLGDDGFGVALASRLSRAALPPGVEVVDFGIRGMDLAYALHDGWDAVVLLDAMPRGGAPGTLYVVEPALDDVEPSVDAHGMDPARVLGLARSLGGELPRTLVVGCEPATRMTGDEVDVVVDLSEPVRLALDGATRLTCDLLDDLTADHRPEGAPS